MAKYFLCLALIFSLISCTSKEKADPKAERDRIRAVVSSKMSEFQRCYEKTIDVRPGASGKVVARWVVDEKGRVDEVEIKDADESLEEIKSCVSNAIRKLQFDSVSGRAPIEVLYPFYFSENGRLERR